MKHIACVEQNYGVLNIIGQRKSMPFDPLKTPMINDMRSNLGFRGYINLAKCFKQLTMSGFHNEETTVSSLNSSQKYFKSRF